MASYEVALKPSVERDLRRLPRDTVARVIARIEALVAQPRGRSAAKLSGSEELYRVRVGN